MRRRRTGAKLCEGVSSDGAPLRNAKHPGGAPCPWMHGVRDSSGTAAIRARKAMRKVFSHRAKHQWEE